MSNNSKFFITLDQISKSYSPRIVLNDINLEFKSSCIYGLIGANGSGKTTLLEILVGLKSYEKGSILFHIDQNHIAIPKNQIGFAGQVPVLWTQLTCKEHAQLLGRFYNLSKEKSMSEMEILFAKFHLTAYQNERIENLSGGLKQRLNLALSLLHKPRILIWDEPTTGLDIDSKLLLRDLLVEYSQESLGIIILSSHDLFELENLCNHLIFLNQGKILAQGSFVELQKKMKDQSNLNKKNIHLEDIYKSLITTTV